MSNWEQRNGDLNSGIKVQLADLESVLKSIDDVISIIDKFNTVTADIVNVVSTISNIPSIDPNTIALQEIQKLIRKLLDDFLGQGVYALPVFPSDALGGLNSIKGGINSFKQKVMQSFEDIYDNNRPVFSDSAYTAGFIVIFNAGIKSTVVDENVSNQVIGSNTTFYTEYSPIVSDYGVPTSLPKDVIVKVNNSVVNVIEVNGLSGYVKIATPPAINSKVTITYSRTFDDAQVLIDTMKATTNLLKMFNFLNNDYRLKMATIESLTTISADKLIQLKWTIGNNGIPADTYEIYRTKYTQESDLELPISSMDKIGIAYIQPTQPYVFNDSTVENETRYIYKIASFLAGNFFTIENEIPRIVASAKSSNFKDQKACANLKCENTINGVVYSCYRKNKSFESDATIDGVLQKNVNGQSQFCKIGKLPCNEYTNKNCKYNSGQKCTSSGFTSSKTQSFDKNGNVVSIQNKSLYIEQYCTDGTNAQYCDGYVEDRIYNQGAPPNWISASIKTILPKEISMVIDPVLSFVDMMVSTTQKADTAIDLLASELASASQSLKDSIIDIRNTIEVLNGIFSLELPSLYVLNIPTQAGGVQAFINSMNNAKGGPAQSNDAYTLGFVLFMGSPDPSIVNGFYSTMDGIL